MEVNGISIERIVLVDGAMVMDEHHLRASLQKLKMWQQQGVEHEWRGLPIDKEIEVLETALEMIE